MDIRLDCNYDKWFQFLQLDCSILTTNMQQTYEGAQVLFPIISQKNVCVKLTIAVSHTEKWIRVHVVNYDCTETGLLCMEHLWDKK